MPSLTRRRVRGGVPPSRLRFRDLGSEALAGLLQRPGRSALTLLGVMLGIGSFVAIVGIAQTASGQIGKQFNVLRATTSYVFDVGAAKSTTPTVDFPPNADALADRIHGVVAAGVYWPVQFKQAAVTAHASGFLVSKRALPVTAASPGLLAAVGVKLISGTLFNQFHETHAQNVAVIGESAAAGLGITSLQSQPTIFIDGQPFTVIGIILSSQRLPQLDVGVTVPEGTALRLWGPPMRLDGRPGAVLTGSPGQSAPGQAADLLAEIKATAATVRQRLADQFAERRERHRDDFAEHQLHNPVNSWFATPLAWTFTPPGGPARSGRLGRRPLRGRPQGLPGRRPAGLLGDRRPGRPQHRSRRGLVHHRTSQLPSAR